MKLRNKKTGEIWDIPHYKEITMDDGKNKYTYKSLAEVNENWEDYTPTEPLIKDLKIRKVVKAWAGCCCFPLLKHYLCDGFSCFIITDEEENDFCLDFNLRIDNLECDKIYTIAELCGEEEE